MRVGRWAVVGALGALFAAAVMLPPGVALAASFTVDSTEDLGDVNTADGVCDADPAPAVTKCTLRAAIAQGEALGGATVITLPSGVYSSPSIGFGSTIEMTINGADEAGTQIVGRVGAPRLTMSNVTVRGVTGAPAVGGVLTLDHVTVRDNAECGLSMGLASRLTNVTVSGNGGCGIQFSGDPAVADSTVRDNAGAGIRLLSNGLPSHLTLTNVTVSGNQDGGIRGQRVTMDNVTVSQNDMEGNAAVGGIQAARLTATNVTVSGNSASDPGGSNVVAGVRIIGEDGGGQSTLDRVTISDNTGGAGLEIGGLGTRVAITGGTIRGNTGGIYGGVDIHADTIVAMQDTSVSDNRATESGGGIHNLGTLTLTNVTIGGNQTTAGSLTASGGGGIYSGQPATLTMTGGSVSTNSATNAGGMYSEGNTTLSDVSVQSNTALRTGGVGGLLLRGAFPTHVITGGSFNGNTGTGLRIEGGRDPRVEGVTVAQNSTSGLDVTGANVSATVLRATIRGNGEGGLVVTTGILELRESTVTGNTTARLGGGIALTGGVVRILNTTITGNHGTGGAPGAGIANRGELTLENVTIADNDTAGDGGRGGGIYNFGRVTMTGGAVRSNRAPIDGGISNAVVNNSSSTVTLADVTIEGNQASQRGAGGLYNEGSATLQNVTIIGNTTLGGPEARGGGISNVGASANLTMTGGAVRNNQAVIHGGIHNAGDASVRARLTLNDLTIDGNQASGEGAGGIGNSGEATINRVTISRNTGPGGGMVNAGVPPPTVIARLTNVTISGNTGVGLAAISAADLTNVTIAANSPGAFGAGGILTTQAARLKNTIIANNGGANCEGGGVVTLGNNLDSDNSCGLQGSQGDLPGRNPHLGALANNGGPTQTHALLTSSPAIDGGANTDCPGTDQRGITRPQGARCDIGAVEQTGASQSSCEERPPVGILTTRSGDGRLQVTITSNTSSTLQANQLQGIRFTRLDNARVSVGDQTVSAPQNVALPGGPERATFFVSRLNGGQPTTVSFEVTDGCPTSWPTFVGGGPSAF